MGDTIDNVPGGRRTMGLGEIARARSKQPKPLSLAERGLCWLEIDFKSAVETGLNPGALGDPIHGFELTVSFEVRDYIHTQATPDEKMAMVSRSALERLNGRGAVVRRLVSEGKLRSSQSLLLIVADLGA